MNNSLTEIFGDSLSQETLNSIRNDLVKYNSTELDKLSFTRTEQDSEQYENVKLDLYLMSSLFPEFDWPLIRLCYILKKWTNEYTKEFYENAREAFSIRQSHDAFIYTCRGILANYSIDESIKLLNNVISSTEDYQLRNIGKIFLSICAYENGDFLEFEKLISDFRESKDADYNPYISIPVSTVFVEPQIPDEPDNFSKNFGKFSEFETEGVEYIISCSSDMVYFRLYGEFIVRSFEHTCSKEAALHISIVDGDDDEINSLLDEWGSNRTFFTNHKQNLSLNFGPIASLIRFISVSELLRFSSLPILVMDLDCVISHPLMKIISENSNSHIGSRILKIGVAPWEKYTGGFAIFYPNEVTQVIADNIRKISLSQMRDDIDQWWIDQNCFEAGIRYAYKSGFDVIISDLFSGRDEYCFMPVGPQNSKLFSLQRELDKVLQNNQ